MRRSLPVSTTPGSTPPGPPRAFPVVGICEAALVTAGQIAKRIAVVTTLPRSIVPLEELVRRYGFAERAKVTACDVAVLDLEKPGSGAEEKLEAEIARALDKGAEAIVLGCAGMADLAPKAVAKVRRARRRWRGGRGEAGRGAGRPEAHDVPARFLRVAGREEIRQACWRRSRQRPQTGSELISPEVSQFEIAV